MRSKLILILLLLPMMAAAQVKFGYISYAEVCRQMPQYAQAQQQLAELKAKYDAEAVRGEEEFQRKFADFLQGQKDFPTNILQKRQAELQDLMDRSVAFRQEAQNLLVQAEQQMMQDVYSQLNAAITAVGMQYGYAFILNTDGNVSPFINPQMGDNVTDLVRVKLGILKQLPAATIKETNASTNATLEGTTGSNKVEVMPIGVSSASEEKATNDDESTENVERVATGDAAM